jgi:hypothetical protein
MRFRFRVVRPDCSGALEDKEVNMT